MSTTYVQRHVFVDSINTSWADIGDMYTIADTYNQVTTAAAIEINPTTAFTAGHSVLTQYAQIVIFLNPSDDADFMTDYAGYIASHPTVDIFTFKNTVEYGI